MTDSSARFDAYAHSYEEEVSRSIAFLGVKLDYVTRVKAAYLLDLLEGHFGETRQLDVLDIGCGTGNCHPLIRDRLGSLTGADVSASSVAEAARRNPGAVYLPYDGTRLPFADGQFDAAVTICVMHHVIPAQWPAFTAEMKRVLRPGGLAVVFEHNPRNPLTRRAVSNCAFDDDAVLLPQSRTRALLEEAGFGNARSRAILTVPSFGSRSRRFDLMLGRLSLGAQYFASGVA